MYRNYYIQTKEEYQNKKHSVRNRILSLMVVGVLGVAGYAIVKGAKGGKMEKSFSTVTPQQVFTTSTPQPTATIKPTVTPEPIREEVVVEDSFHKGDTVVATSDVRLRLDTNTNSFKLGVLPEGSVVNRLLSDGEWDLIQYGDTIAYVHSDYTKKYEMDCNNEYYHLEEDNDIARTTAEVRFRLGPSTDEKKLFTLDNNEELVVLGKAIPNSNPSDVWLLCRARGQIGFVNQKYTVSFKEQLRNHHINLDDIKIQKLAYVKRDSNLYDVSGNTITSIDKYQLVEVLQREGESSLVVCGDKAGFIDTNNLQTINGSFLSVDLSDQRISYYVDNDVAFRDKCTTGADRSPTEIGYYKPYGKSNSHDFGHDGYKAVKLWMPFNGGQGLHDAPWESVKKFGDSSYRKHKGSAGCVRLPNDAADFIYENVSKDTHVLIKK